MITKVYQIWWETSIGPTFATKQEAIDHLYEECYDEEEKEQLKKNFESKYPDYPAVQEIVLGQKVSWDR